VFALNEGAKIEGENHLRYGVGLCGVGKSGLGVATTQGGTVVPFPAFDLRLKTAEEGGS
jgi:hypothetical protein